MKKLFIIILLSIGYSSFSQNLNIKGFGDWEKTMVGLSTNITNIQCLDNSFLVENKIKSVKKICSNFDSITGYSSFSINLTEYNKKGIIKSIKYMPFDSGYCYEYSYNYDTIYCTYKIVYKSNCGIIEPNGEIGSIRGFKLLEKHSFYDSDTGLKVEEKEIYDSNTVVYKYEYNSKGLVIKITKYLNQKEQYKTEFEYKYYE